jgi:protein-S-isoprenylcysteine O-methyltransferase Ste14
VNNITYWFAEPFSVNQIFSWLFLVYSLILLIPGVILMKNSGNPQTSRNDSTLYKFEKTTELVETGIFRYVRHPLYGSLLFLGWGVCLKNPEFVIVILSLAATVFFYLTAVMEEKEDIEYFGEKYRAYAGRSKMFIPYIL